jgi:glycosyltransferase involved in cell wall biosynthesis
MKLALVCHDASLTGAPKLGFDIAAFLAERHAVTLICKKGGPLLDLAHYRRRIEDILVTDSSHEISKSPFGLRVEMAQKSLREISPDLLYVNSAASAEWCVAGRQLGMPVVFHVHEMQGGLLSLIGADIFKLDIARYVDWLVTASVSVIRDLELLVWPSFKRIHNFDIALDVKRILTLRTAEAPAPVNVDGRPLTRNRPTVAMCGTASVRKGTDLFFRLAERLPDIQFLWIGTWFPKEARDNPAYADFAQGRAPNLFVTGLTDNPYTYLDLCDLFVLTSREDPNPLVVAEAIVLGKKVVGFAETGGSKSFLERFGYALSGNVDVDRLARLVTRMLAAPATPEWLARRLEEFRRIVDLDTKMVDLERGLLALHREFRSPAPSADLRPFLSAGPDAISAPVGA